MRTASPQENVEKRIVLSDVNAQVCNCVLRVFALTRLVIDLCEDAREGLRSCPSIIDVTLDQS